MSLARHAKSLVCALLFAGKRGFFTRRCNDIHLSCNHAITSCFCSDKRFQVLAGP